MARGKPATAQSADDQVSLLDIVRVRRQAIENAPPSREQVRPWDETVLTPNPQAREVFGQQTIGRFLGGRSEWAQLAMLEDWLRTSVGMPSHIDELLNKALDSRLRSLKRVEGLQKALFLVIGLLLGVVSGLVAGYLVGHMALR